MLLAAPYVPAFCHAFAFRLVIIAEQASLSHSTYCPPDFVPMVILRHPLAALLVYSSSSRNDFPVNHHFRWILVIIEFLPVCLVELSFLLVASAVYCVVHRVRGWGFWESVLCAVALFFELGLERVFHGLRKGFSGLGRDYS
jgi:hypothetical protein